MLNARIAFSACQSYRKRVCVSPCVTYFTKTWMDRHWIVVVKKSGKYLNDSHQIKSLQWLQKVGCLKKRGTNLWSLISKTFFCRKAPRRCTPFTATGSESAIFALTVSIRVCVRESKVRAGVDFKASARARWLADARYRAAPHIHTHDLTRTNKGGNSEWLAHALTDRHNHVARAGVAQW